MRSADLAKLQEIGAALDASSFGKKIIAVAIAMTAAVLLAAHANEVYLDRWARSSSMVSSTTMYLKKPR